MPFDFGASIISVSYNPSTLAVVFTVTGAGEGLYPVSRVWLSKGATTYAITLTGWSDTEVTGDLAASLPEGNFTANMTTSDNETVSRDNAVSISSAGGGECLALAVGAELVV